VHLAYFQPLYHLSAKNYQNWRKFDEVVTKTILHSFFETRRMFSNYSATRTRSLVSFAMYRTVDLPLTALQTLHWQLLIDRITQDRRHNQSHIEHRCLCKSDITCILSEYLSSDNRRLQNDTINRTAMDDILTRLQASNHI